MFSCNDGGPKRIAMRRSPDSGATWEPTQWIYNDTALEPLPKAQRWAKWNQMGGANFVSAPASSRAGVREGFACRPDLGHDRHNECAGNKYQE